MDWRKPVFVVATFVSLSASAEDAFDLKGDKLGSSLAAWEEKHGECRDRSIDDLIRCDLETTVADKSVLVEYDFVKPTGERDVKTASALARIRVMPSRERDPTTAFVIHSALLAKYGQPKSKRRPDADSPGEPGLFNLPADSWVLGKTEILFTHTDPGAFDLTLVHWRLWLQHTRKQTANQAKDL